MLTAMSFDELTAAQPLGLHNSMSRVTNINFQISREYCVFDWPAVVTFTIKKFSDKQLEHFIIRTNLVGPQEFELSELHSRSAWHFSDFTSPLLLLS